MNFNGYECFTTFWQDFTIAEKYGVSAVKDTYDRAFNDWKNNYRYLTELVMVLNNKCWHHYENGMTTLSELYSDLYYEASGYAYDNLTGRELDYYISITD